MAETSGSGWGWLLPLSHRIKIYELFLESQIPLIRTRLPYLTLNMSLLSMPYTYMHCHGLHRPLLPSLPTAGLRELKALLAPKPPQGVLERGHAGLVIRKLSPQRSALWGSLFS